jgi:1,4-dihydroxy-2-naphthoate octaprenyltransferase
MTAPALPQTEPRPSTLRVWVLATRPATLPASLAPVVAGSVLAWALGGFRWGVLVAALLGAALIQIGTNLANDYFDWKKGTDDDQRLGPARVTQKGWIPPQTVAGATALAFALAALVGVYLVSVGGWPIVALGLASIAAGVGYTAGRYALAYVGLGELFVLAFFGVAAVAATAYLHTDALSADTVVAGVALGMSASAILVVNNLRDLDGDRRAQKRTLAVRFGEAWTRREYVALMLLPYPLWLGWVLATGRPWTWLAPVLSLPLAIGTVRAVGRTSGRALNPLLGRTAQVELVFAMLVAGGAIAGHALGLEAPSGAPRVSAAQEGAR